MRSNCNHPPGEMFTLSRQSRIVFFLMNIHNKYRTIYFARVCLPTSILLNTFDQRFFQSGQSLIEHSYRADSDLSPAGWEYAERLKDFVLERRAKAIEQKGLKPDRKLVVSVSILLLFGSQSIQIPRSGPQPDVALTTPPGPSSHSHKAQTHHPSPPSVPSQT